MAKEGRGAEGAGRGLEVAGPQVLKEVCELASCGEGSDLALVVLAAHLQGPDLTLNEGRNDHVTRCEDLEAVGAGLGGQLVETHAAERGGALCAGSRLIKNATAQTAHEIVAQLLGEPSGVDLWA